MTEQIHCHKGVCKDKKAFLDECIDCNIVEQIEHDLLKEDLKTIEGG